jgi:hypothetical protein
MLLFQFEIILVITLLILSIFSCNKYYFILDAIIISILGILYLFLYINDNIYKYFNFYICTRSVIILILFVKKLINKEMIKIKNINLDHKIFLIINIIINLFFIISYINLFIKAYA